MILNSTSYYNLIPEEVCLEISENTFVRDMDHCIKIIEKLKSHNYIIAIDDFGSKYSSIGILYKIPFDILKTDGIFAKNIENKQIYELLETITKIVLESNKEIVIERVETIKEANIFNVLGRFLHQGYYYHKPEKIVKNQKKD